MRPGPLAGGALLGLLAFVLVIAGADTTSAGTFNPTLEVTVANPEPGANSDFISDFNLPEGDVNFAGVVGFIPGDWGLVPGDQISIGAVVGIVTAQAQLGLINAACANPLPVTFTMLNASIDPSDTVDYLDTDDNGTENYAEDLDESGLQDGFEKYPDFIARVLVDESDQPLQPIRRSAGITIVAGISVLLQFLIFEPGTFIDEEIPNDEELGYPSVTLLQNAGDPDFDPIPGPITDFCTPLLSKITSFGITKDNACTDDIPREQLDPICEVRSAPIEVAEEGGTNPDEGGLTLSTNPQDGTYTFTTIAVGLRDADDDGIENFLDTCAFDANEGDPRINADGDDDSDGLDAACDPNDDETNSDEDLDGYLNRGDNCPLSANGEEEDNQRDTDNDQIGDACDPNPDDADPQGELARAAVTADVIIGTGTGEGGPFGEADGGDGDGGGGGTVIIIIIVVIAAVVVVGGGALYFMRRGSGGTTGSV